MAKIAHNDAKNVSTGHTPFEPNCNYYPRISFEEDINLCSQSKSINKLLVELQDLKTVGLENLHHAQEFQKQVYNTGAKLRNYASNEKIWLNSK